MSRAGDIVKRFCESDFDDEDMAHLQSRTDKVRDTERDARFYKAQRSVSNKSPDELSVYLWKLNRDNHVIEPARARAIVNKLGGNKFGPLPRLGYEKMIGEIKMTPSQREKLESGGIKHFGSDKWEVWMGHDGQGYRIRLRAAS